MITQRRASLHDGRETDVALKGRSLNLDDLSGATAPGQGVPRGPERAVVPERNCGENRDFRSDLTARSRIDIAGVNRTSDASAGNEIRLNGKPTVLVKFGDVEIAVRVECQIDDGGEAAIEYLLTIRVGAHGSGGMGRDPPDIGCPGRGRKALELADVVIPIGAYGNTGRYGLSRKLWWETTGRGLRSGTADQFLDVCRRHHLIGQYGKHVDAALVVHPEQGIGTRICDQCSFTTERLDVERVRVHRATVGIVGILKVEEIGDQSVFALRDPIERLIGILAGVPGESLEGPQGAASERAHVGDAGQDDVGDTVTRNDAGASIGNEDVAIWSSGVIAIERTSANVKVSMCLIKNPPPSALCGS